MAIDRNNPDVKKILDKYASAYIRESGGSWVRAGDGQPAAKTQQVQMDGTSLTIADTGTGYGIYEWNGKTWDLIVNTCNPPPAPPAHSPGPGNVGMQVQLPCPVSPVT